MQLENLFGPITQIGYLTDDIETTAGFWTQTSGIGPWTRMSGVSMATTMDGQPSDINIDVAITYKGDVQIELIKPFATHPLPIRHISRLDYGGSTMCNSQPKIWTLQ